MRRRDLVQSIAVTALAGVAMQALAQNHAHHHGGSAPYQELIDSTAGCVTKGEACMAHCLVLLGQGDKTMAGCAQSVNQMLAVCNALLKLAAQNAKATKALAKLAGDVCADCEKECRKHAEKHSECKACADACADCIRQCKAVAGSS